MSHSWRYNQRDIQTKCYRLRLTASQSLGVFLALCFALSGCGPSAGEQKAHTDLAEAQKQVAVLDVELKSVQERLSEEKSSRKDESVKAAAELERLRKQLNEVQVASTSEIAGLGEQLRDAQSAATEALTKIRELNEEKLKNASPPQYDVTGEIFIVTKGGDNFRLGRVAVMVFDRRTAEAFLVKRREEQAQLLAALKPKLEQAIEEYDQAQQTFNAIVQPTLGLNRFASSAAQPIRDKAYQEYLPKEKAKESLLAEQSALLTATFYFDALPSPIMNVKTDSDGKFKFSVPRDKEVMIAAHASRAVGDYGEDKPLTKTNGISGNAQWQQGD